MVLPGLVLDFRNAAAAHHIADAAVVHIVAVAHIVAVVHIAVVAGVRIGPSVPDVAAVVVVSIFPLYH